MSYYDNVKENIRSKNKEKRESEEGDGMTGNFDSLKEAAQQNQNEDEGDDTPIEVLEEDGISTESPSRKQKKQQQQPQQRQEENPLKQKASKEKSTQSSTEADLSRVEDKLDRIIEQNDELIEILRSFAQ